MTRRVIAVVDDDVHDARSPEHVPKSTLYRRLEKLGLDVK